MVATIMTYQVPTLHSAKQATSTMVRNSVPIWLFRTLLVILSVAQHGVSIHNGGGVDGGEVINGGFGMVIDGSEDSARHIRQMLLWDVNNGISRRSWARNKVQSMLSSVKWNVLLV